MSVGVRMIRRTLRSPVHQMAAAAVCSPERDHRVRGMEDFL